VAFEGDVVGEVMRWKVGSVTVRKSSVRTEEKLACEEKLINVCENSAEREKLVFRI